MDTMTEAEYLAELARQQGGGQSFLTPFEEQNREALIARNEEELLRRQSSPERQRFEEYANSYTPYIDAAAEKLTGYGNRLSSGATFGLLGDEFNAALAAMPERVLGGNFDAAYESALNKIRRAETASREGLADAALYDLAPRVLSGIALAQSIPAMSGKAGAGAGFWATRARDFGSGASIAGVEGFMGAEGGFGNRVSEGLTQGGVGGFISSALNPITRGLSGAKQAGRQVERAQELKAMGLTPGEMAKRSRPDDAIEGGNIARRHVKQILNDVDAPSAQNTEQLFNRMNSREQQIKSWYNELFDKAKSIMGARKIRLNKRDLKPVEDWIESASVPSTDRSMLRKMFKEVTDELNESLASSGNPFRQLMTDRTWLKKAFKDASPSQISIIDQMNQRLRRLLSAKLKASLDTLPKSKDARFLGKELSKLDKAYAPYAALRNQRAKVMGQNAFTMSFDNVLANMATTKGVGQTIVAAASQGLVPGLLTAAGAVPAAMIARTATGALQLGRNARSIGNVVGAFGRGSRAMPNPLLGYGASSLARDNSRFYEEQEQQSRRRGY